MLQPLFDWVLLRPIEPEKEKKTSSGLVIPDSGDSFSLPMGEVMEVGPGTHDYNGNLHPTPLNVGDIVLYTKQGIDHEIDHVKYYLLHAASVIAILPKES